jgi:tetratricopeptide (TPR) repeat protein
LFFAATFNVYGASYPKAVMLNEHGLIGESKSELIDVLFSTAPDTEKAKAFYLLGSIAFTENKISTALESWWQLLKKYPTSKEAITVKDRIKELAEIVGEVEKESIENAIAQSYLRNGDFWSKGKDHNFIIDSSWIQNVEVAITWYDKVIREYPGSTASRVAYEEKMRTLLGWKEAGKDGKEYGVKQSLVLYMPQLLETFKDFEKEHPNAPTMQAFRYQIAQAYWHYKNWAKTREWLNLVIEKAGESDSFYKETAKRRLEKVEW